MVDVVWLSDDDGTEDESASDNSDAVVPDNTSVVLADDLFAAVVVLEAA